jgi:hypothetical protein
MRYLLITYFKKADGRVDEQVEVTATLKARDLQTANIILDFKEKKVEKAYIEGNTIPHEWERIEEYYHQVYPDLIEDLRKQNTSE